MHYSFDIELAKKYGDREAIMLQSFIYWIAKNAANGRHFHDGRYWTYNSVAAFVKMFPFWSTSQVRTILSSLAKQGCIIVGNFNGMGCDRTKWYALGDEIDKWICEISQMGSGNGENAFANINKPIPVILPITNTVVCDTRAHARDNNNSGFDFREALLALGISKQTADDWLEVRKANRATNTKTAFDRLAREIKKIADKSGYTADEIVAIAVSSGWKGINAEWEAYQKLKPKTQQMNYDQMVERERAEIEENRKKIGL